MPLRLWWAVIGSPFTVQFSFSILSVVTVSYFVIASQAINPCLQNICHPHARCTYLGPNRHSCTCQEGYHGDGRVCLPVDPCQTNFGHCPTKSTVCIYDGPGQVSEWCTELMRTEVGQPTEGKTCQRCNLSFVPSILPVSVRFGLPLQTDLHVLSADFNMSPPPSILYTFSKLASQNLTVLHSLLSQPYMLFDKIYTQLKLDEQINCLPRVSV